MNIILFGPPGAGKGTQADNITKSFNFYKISTGDLLRNEINLHTNLGKKIKSIINRGELVDDEIINSLISDVILIPDNHNRLILDGFPRNLSQVDILEKLLKKQNQKISAAFILDVKKDIITKRINGRVSCTKCFKTFNEFFNPPSRQNHTCGEKYLQKRNDDKMEIVLSRFETFAVKTKPVLDYYKKKNLFYKINGNKEIDQIYNEIKVILENIRD